MALPKVLKPQHLCTDVHSVPDIEQEIYIDGFAFMFSCCISSSFMNLFTIYLTCKILTSNFLTSPNIPSPDTFKAESWHCYHFYQVLISYKTFATATKEL